MKQTRPPQGAQAALRAVRLLKLFSNERPEMSLAELSRASGLNKTTTHRLLRALQSESLVDRNPATSAYSLGPGLMALGVQALASSDLRRRVRPVLRSLARETGETATLEIPFEESMLILDEVAGRHVLGSAGNIGTRWPLHATSTGKAWLAFDEFGIERLGSSMDALTQNTVTTREDFAAQFVEIRKRGYAISVDELEEGFTAVATIFRGVLGDVQGAISIGGPTQRFSMVRCAEFGTALRRAAQRLTPEI